MTNVYTTALAYSVQDFEGAEKYSDVAAMAAISCSRRMWYALSPRWSCDLSIQGKNQLATLRLSPTYCVSQSLTFESTDFTDDDILAALGSVWCCKQLFLLDATLSDGFVAKLRPFADNLQLIDFRAGLDNAAMHTVRLLTDACDHKFGTMALYNCGYQIAARHEPEFDQLVEAGFYRALRRIFARTKLLPVESGVYETLLHALNEVLEQEPTPVEEDGGEELARLLDAIITLSDLGHPPTLVSLTSVVTTFVTDEAQNDAAIFSKVWDSGVLLCLLNMLQGMTRTPAEIRKVARSVEGCKIAANCLASLANVVTQRLAGRGASGLALYQKIFDRGGGALEPALQLLRFLASAEGEAIATAIEAPMELESATLALVNSAWELVNVMAVFFADKFIAFSALKEEQQQSFELHRLAMRYFKATSEKLIAEHARLGGVGSDSLDLGEEVFQERLNVCGLIAQILFLPLVVDEERLQSLTSFAIDLQLPPECSTSDFSPRKRERIRRRRFLNLVAPKRAGGADDTTDGRVTQAELGFVAGTTLTLLSDVMLDVLVAAARLDDLVRDEDEDISINSDFVSEMAKGAAAILCALDALPSREGGAAGAGARRDREDAEDSDEDADARAVRLRDEAELMNEEMQSKLRAFVVDVVSKQLEAHGPLLSEERDRALTAKEVRGYSVFDLVDFSEMDGMLQMLCDENAEYRGVS